MPRKFSVGSKQPRFCKTDEHRIGAVFGAQAAIAESRARFAGIFFFVGNADFGGVEAAATFENSQDVAGLRNFVTQQWIEIRHDALGERFLRRRRRHGLQSLRRAVHAVAFAEACLFERHGAVVVQRRAPQHAAVRHHAVADFQHFLGMAVTATDVGHAQIAGIDKANELWRFVIQQRVAPHRIAGTRPGIGKTRKDVGALLSSSRWGRRRGSRSIPNAPLPCRACRSRLDGTGCSRCFCPAPRQAFVGAGRCPASQAGTGNGSPAVNSAARAKVMLDSRTAIATKQSRPLRMSE